MLKLPVNLVFRFRTKFRHKKSSARHRFFSHFFADPRALMKKRVQIGGKSDHFFSHKNQTMPTVAWSFYCGTPLICTHKHRKYRKLRLLECTFDVPDVRTYLMAHATSKSNVSGFQRRVPIVTTTKIVWGGLITYIPCRYFLLQLLQLLRLDKFLKN